MDSQPADAGPAMVDGAVDEPGSDGASEAADNPFDAYLDAEGEPPTDESSEPPVDGWSEPPADEPLEPPEGSTDDGPSAEGWGIDGVDPDEER